MTDEKVIMSWLPFNVCVLLSYNKHTHSSELINILLVLYIHLHMQCYEPTQEAQLELLGKSQDFDAYYILFNARYLHNVMFR